MEFFGLEAIKIILISFLKFIIASPISHSIGFGSLQTFFLMVIGGTLSILIFFHLSIFLIKEFNKYKGILIGDVNLYRFIILKYMLWKRKQKKNYKKLRRYVVFRNRWGLPGLVILTPVLSMPLGTLLCVRFYQKRRKQVLIYLFLSVICWSFVLSFLF